MLLLPLPAPFPAEPPGAERLSASRRAPRPAASLVRQFSPPCAAATQSCPALPDELVHESLDAQTGELTQVFFSTTRAVDVAQLERLSAAVGWPARPRAKVAAALRHSYMVATLTSPTAGGDRLVGVARATSDHVFNATLWDVLVAPELQGRGLGRLLVDKFTAALLSRGLANVSLFADAQAVGFYRGSGFVTEPGGIRCMFYLPAGGRPLV